LSLGVWVTVSGSPWAFVLVVDALAVRGLDVSDLALGIVLDLGFVAVRVGDREQVAGFGIALELGDVALGVGDFCDLAEAVVLVLRCRAVGLGAA
jgi:hypothetical protein